MSCDVRREMDMLENDISVTLPTLQLILQHFRCFTYVTAYSPALLSLLLRHKLFTYVTWRAAHVGGGGRRQVSLSPEYTTPTQVISRCLTLVAIESDATLPVNDPVASIAPSTASYLRYPNCVVLKPRSNSTVISYRDVETATSPVR